MIRAGALALSGVLALGCTCQAPRTEIPEYTATFATQPPHIDGVLDEAVWRTDPTAPFVHTMTGEPAAPESTARIAWDDVNLYVAFEVADDWIHSDLEGHDAHLWEQDTVELMVDPDGDGQNYFELQLSPTGEVFDTRYSSRRVPQPFGVVSWDSGLRGACQIDGAANDGQADTGYTAELAIPFASFTGHQRPNAGDVWRVALYVLDKREEGWRGVGWSAPMEGDFHVPARFGRVRFAR